MSIRAQPTSHKWIRSLKIGLLALVAAGAVSGCDTGYKFATNAPGPGGTTTQNSTPGTGGASATNSTVGAPSCGAKSLAGKGSRRQNPNDGGGAIGEVLISNTSAYACELQGIPDIHLVSATGSLLPVENSIAITPPQPGVVLQPDQRSSAELVFTWQNWCESPPGEIEMLIDLANSGGTFTAPLDGEHGSYVPTCGRPNTPSAIRVQYAYVNSGTTKLSSA